MEGASEGDRGSISRRKGQYYRAFMFTEAGGSEVNPNHEPHCPRGGFTAEMQVSINWSEPRCNFSVSAK